MSHKHSKHHPQVQVICPNCKNPFMVDYSHLKKLKPGVEPFCSIKCRYEIKHFSKENLHKFYTEDKNGCWIFNRKANNIRYGVVWYKGKLRGAHQASFMLHLSPKLNHLPRGQVCHSCDCPACFNPSHLFFSNAAGNVHDCIRKGRNSRGEKHPISKLTETQVREIFELCKTTNNYRQIARDFGVSDPTIHKIKNGKRWKHLKLLEENPAASA